MTTADSINLRPSRDMGQVARGKWLAAITGRVWVCMVCVCVCVYVCVWCMSAAYPYCFTCQNLCLLKKISSAHRKVNLVDIVLAKDDQRSQFTSRRTLPSTSLSCGHKMAAWMSICQPVLSANSPCVASQRGRVCEPGPRTEMYLMAGDIYFKSHYCI